jgi:hypothetical protein
MACTIRKGESQGAGTMIKETTTPLLLLLFYFFSAPILRLGLREFTVKSLEDTPYLLIQKTNHLKRERNLGPAYMKSFNFEMGDYIKF